jgi:hypothetical protein
VRSLNLFFGKIVQKLFFLFLCSNCWSKLIEEFFCDIF